MASSSSDLLSRMPLLSLLKRSASLSQVLQVHAQLVTRALAPDPFFSGGLLLAAAEICRTSTAVTAYAELIFSLFLRPNTFVWNTVLRIHAGGPEPRRAIVFYRHMRREGVDTDGHTYPFVLKACGFFRGRREGVQVHGEVVKRGWDPDLFVTNGLISLYCRCGMLAAARALFDGFSRKDLVSWNTMIGGYAARGEMRDARALFDEMPQKDGFSWAIMIDGYGKKARDVDAARNLFDQITEKDIVCWNSMIDGYAGVGRMENACELFEEMPGRNVVSWSVLIDGYAKHGYPMKALVLFQQMLQRGIKADKVCAVGAISACAQLGALDLGRWVHFYLEKNKILLDVVIQTALVDMYMKCGSLTYARRLFHSMSARNVISWNVMIVGLGANGNGEEALKLFCQLERECATMDGLIFLSVLSACTHSGLVDEGLSIFRRMEAEFRIKPSIEHYGCLVNLLGRAGRLVEAKNVIDAMPLKANSSELWWSLLAACRLHRSVELAESCVQKLKELSADDCGVYVLMSNIYADEGMWEDVGRTRRLMNDRGIMKESGRSLIELEGIIHEFVSGENSHFLKDEIVRVIWGLFRIYTSLV